MLKIFALLLLVIAIGQCSKLSDAILDELIEKYEEKKRGDDIDPRFCGATDFDCYKCPECHDATQFGLCIKGASSSRCLCKWGFTGPNALRVKDANKGVWSRNRIRADNCKTHCHYTHDHWNPDCLGGGPKCDDELCKLKYGKCIDDECVPDCDEEKCRSKYGKCIKGICIPDCDEEKCRSEYGKCIKGKCVPDCDEEKCRSKYGKCIQGKCIPDCDEEKCRSKYGKCIKGKCVPDCDKYKCEAAGGKCMKGVCKIRCCRNLLQSVPPYHGGNFKDYCDGRCEWVELKPKACPAPHITPPCNPKCKASGGKCNEATGRCQCCKDFTGPNPRTFDGVLTADHCGVWCPHHLKDGSQNLLCLNDDFVKRAEKNQDNSSPVISDYSW